MRHLVLMLILLAIAHSVLAEEAPVSPAEEKSPSVNFEADVVPVFRAYCWKCHGGEGLEAGLDLRTLPLIQQGGQQGPVLVAGDAEASRLFQRVSRGEMPPGDGLKPTEAQMAILRDWITAGAPANYVGETIPKRELADDDRSWWAFQNPQYTTFPKSANEKLVANPIDAYLLEKLAAENLTFSPPAERFTWLRRVSLDLIGLPPRPAEQVEFLADNAPDAAERLVDRLLSSPHAGEQWGRHWLDAAGYVDTIGSDNDASIIEERERIWKYRDYVIRSLNADLPFDRFLLEQMAGDELVDWKTAAHYDPAALDLLIATGFLRQAADVTYAPELNTSDIRHQVLYDTVQIVSSNVLGLTLHCAQCHDHKFDPISQTEYYQFLAYFSPAYDPQHWKHSKERHLFDVSPGEQAVIDQKNAEIDQKIQGLKEQIAKAREPFSARLKATKLASLPEAVRTDTQTAVNTPADKRSDVQKYLAEKLGPMLAVSEQEIDQALDEPTRSATSQWNAEIQQLSSSKSSYGKLQSLWNVSTPRTYLYRRGDYQTPGPEVHPGVPAVLQVSTSNANSTSSEGVRTRLARWLTQRDHPLTGRVFVNRVWQSLFGRGIVSTPDNFGLSGAKPTHPELLDWLALEFVRKEWSFKQLLRQITSSTAYRQASQTAESSAELHQRAESCDPENLLLWRMPLRRLDSETIRDSILAVGDHLDETLYGPPIPLKPLPDGRVEVDLSKLPPATSPDRRSLYLFCRRNYQLTELSVFDQPVISHNCTRRINTAVVLQSLTLLNGAWAIDQSERIAETVQSDVPVDLQEWILRAYQRTFNRRPEPEELATAQAFLEQQMERLRPQMSAEEAAKVACRHLCQMLVNASEFLYIP